LNNVQASVIDLTATTSSNNSSTMPPPKYENLAFHKMKLAGHSVNQQSYGEFDENDLPTYENVSKN
jgi:hypothetical protein